MMRTIFTEGDKEGLMTKLSPSEKLHVISSLKQFLLSCFGPRGRAKYVQNTHSALMTLSASSQSLFSNLNFVSPISKLVAAGVLQQVSTYSDNGLYTGIITVSLIEGAIKASLHHRLCCQVNELLLTSCLAAIKDISFEVDLSDLDAMLCLVRSIFSSKPSCCLNAAEMDSLSSLVLQTLFLNLPDDLPKSLPIPLIEFVSMPGYPVTETKLFSGVLLEVPVNFHRVVTAWKKKKPGEGETDMKVALFEDSLAIDKCPFPGAILEANSGIDILEHEVQQMKGLSLRIHQAGVKFVGCQKVIHPFLVKSLHKIGILTVDRLSFKHIGALQNLTGARPFSSMNCDISEDSLGSLRDVSPLSVLDRPLLHLTASSGQQKKVTTVILCHRTEACLQELRHAFNVAYHVASLSISHPEVVPGGGIFEAQLIAATRGKLVKLLEGAESNLSCSSHQFSQAAEVFLGSLGCITQALKLDPAVSRPSDQTCFQVSTDEKLDFAMNEHIPSPPDPRSKRGQGESHQHGMFKWKGEDCGNRKGFSKWNGKVVDLLIVKMNALKMAVEMANLILSIGAVVSTPEV